MNHQPTMMRTRYGLLLLAACLVIAGCGSEAGETPGDAVSPGPSAVMTTPRVSQNADPVADAPPAADTTDAGPMAAPAATAPEASAGPRASAWLAPADRAAFDLDLTMTNQDGEPVTLSDLRGKPMAMTFFYTRCPLPEMCPLIVATAARLQESLEKAGIGDQVQLVLISYDPVYDTPERMRDYTAKRGLKFHNAHVLRPDPETMRQVLGTFQIGASYGGGSGEIGHYIEMLLIDSQGRFVRDYQGEVWDNGVVLADFQRLLAEQHDATSGVAAQPNG